MAYAFGSEPLAIWSTCRILQSFLCRTLHLNHKNKTRDSVSRDSTASASTRYGLDNLGIESQWEQNFPHPSRLALRSTQPPIKCILDLFPGGKVAGVWH